MYVIIVYDVSVERVSKICQYLRRYLNWVQNSVFEGEIGKAVLEEIKIGIKGIIDEHEDSVRIYILPNERPLKREVIGTEKVELGNVI